MVLSPLSRSLTAPEEVMSMSLRLATDVLRSSTEPHTAGLSLPQPTSEAPRTSATTVRARGDLMPLTILRTARSLRPHPIGAVRRRRCDAQAFDWRTHTGMSGVGDDVGGRLTSRRDQRHGYRGPPRT